MSSKRETDIKLLENTLRSYPDFPRHGILFQDIFSILGNSNASKILFSVLTEDCETYRGKVDAVCGLDSRGFLFGPTIAMHLNVPFIPIRKKGKLPGKTKSIKFDLEYGSDEFEVQEEYVQGKSCLVIDDLLATGGKSDIAATLHSISNDSLIGSLKAAGSLIESLGAKVTVCIVVMELVQLSGRSIIPYPVHSILHI